MPAAITAIATRTPAWHCRTPSHAHRARAIAAPPLAKSERLSATAEVTSFRVGVAPRHGIAGSSSVPAALQGDGDAPRRRGAGTPGDVVAAAVINGHKETTVINLDMEVLENVEAPLTTQEGIGLTLMALGAGMLVGLALT